MSATDPLALLLDDLAARVAERVLSELRHHRQAQPQSTAQLDAPRFAGEQDIAKRFDLKVPTLQSWRSTGRGPPFVKAGRRVLYELAAVERWLREGGSSAASASAPTSRRGRRAASQDQSSV